jgi:hypothetical protein
VGVQGKQRLHGVGSGVLRVKLWVGSRVDKVPSHPIILARSVLVPFEVSRERSKGGVGEDVGLLGQDVGGIGFERLLCDCPVSHRKQESVLVRNGERGQRCQKHSVRIEV